MKQRKSKKKFINKELDIEQIKKEYEKIKLRMEIE
jgi:hypothetical protein